MKKIPLLLLLVISIVYANKIIIISNPLLINYYPFISPDGFDWITEGVWLFQTLQGKDTSNIILPIARPPLFVVITALDAFLGQKGYILASVLGGSFFATGFFTTKLIDENKNLILSAVFLLALLFTPVNFIRIWVLSDAICVSLSLIACYYLLKSKDNFPLLQLVLLSMVIALAGITQIYGLIAPFIILGLSLLSALQDKNFVLIIKISTILLFSFLLFLGATTWWFNFIPHLERPTNFAYLKLTTTMLTFYFNVWSYYFAPFIPMVFILPFLKKNTIKNDRVLISSWIIVFAFMIMIFFYQWPESRFTFIFWPFFIIAIFRTCSYTQEKYKKLQLAMLSLTTILLLLQSFILHAHDWQPRITQIEINPKKTWGAQLMLAEPIDRFYLTTNCENSHTMCSNMLINTNMDNYVKNVMKSYIQLVEIK